jgi:hypothetical protein
MPLRLMQKSTHEFATDGEREQSSLNRAENRFDKDNRLCRSSRRARLGFLERH